MTEDDKPVGGFFWGAPIKMFRQSEARQEILKHFFWLKAEGSEVAAAADWEKVDDYVYALHGRLTDKCAALLQTVAVVAAIETVFIAQDIEARETANLPLGYAAVACFFFCALLLSMNLFVYWPRYTIKSAGVAEQGRRIWRVSLVKMVQERTWKHTLAVWLLLLGLAFSVVDRALDIGDWSSPLASQTSSSQADSTRAPQQTDLPGPAAVSSNELLREIESAAPLPPLPPNSTSPAQAGSSVHAQEDVAPETLRAPEPRSEAVDEDADVQSIGPES